MKNILAATGNTQKWIEVLFLMVASTFILFFLYIGVSSIIKKDTVIDEMLNTTSPETSFKILDMKFNIIDSKELKVKGQLGAFYNCLRGYRAISSMRGKKSNENFSYRLYMVEKGNYYWINVSGGEVFRFKAYVNGNASNAYAVNCSLDLLE